MRHELLTAVFWELILAKTVPEQAAPFALTVSSQDWPSNRCMNLKVSVTLCHWLQSKPKSEFHPVGKTAFLDFSMPHSNCFHKQYSQFSSPKNLRDFQFPHLATLPKLRLTWPITNVLHHLPALSEISWGTKSHARSPGFAHPLCALCPKHRNPSCPHQPGLPFLLQVPSNFFHGI